MKIAVPVVETQVFPGEIRHRRQQDAKTEDFILRDILWECVRVQEEYWDLRESNFREDEKIANEELIIGNVQPIHKEGEFGWSLWYVRGGNVYRIVVQKLGI